MSTKKIKLTSGNRAIISSTWLQIRSEQIVNLLKKVKRAEKKGEKIKNFYKLMIHFGKG